MKQVSNITVCEDHGDCLKGKQVVIIFKKPVKAKDFSLIRGSHSHRGSAQIFRGDEDVPVVCILESSYHKSSEELT